MIFLKFLKNVLLFVAVFAALGLIFLIFKTPILTFTGDYLVKVSPDQKVDAAFVLSGQPAERLPEAKKVYDQGFASLLICTGGQVDPDVEVLGLGYKDADLAQKVLWEMGVDSSAVLTLDKGTSTFEESEEILGYVLASGYKKIMIISSAFHTRRITRVFKEKFAKNGITVLVHAAPPKDYALKAWWTSEEGLIFVNNEYLKLLYYAWTY